MQSLSIVVAQKDQASAHRIAQSLRNHVRQVFIAKTADEISEAILKLHAQAAIVDLELMQDAQLRQLCLHFDRTAVVTTHRAPDDEMWMESMTLGAVDCCQQGDTDGILRAIAHNVLLTRANAA